MKYMPNLESIAKEMFDKWTDGTFVWEMDKTEKSLWIKLARWHAIEVLKARIEYLKDFEREKWEAFTKGCKTKTLAERFAELQSELKSLEVEK